MEIIPITPNTLATVASGIARLNLATKAVQQHNTKAQSNKEPSCAPQTPETKYNIGKAVFEFIAAYFTEKSCVKKL